MESTLHDLRELLIKAIPTILFFVFLTYYLKKTFFQPIAKILEERRRATEGVREIAQKAFEAADARGAEFEAALAAARAEIHKEQEALRNQWRAEQSEAIDRARHEAEQQIHAAKQEIAAETERVQSEMDAQIDSLSKQIVQALLQRRAA